MRPRNHMQMRKCRDSVGEAGIRFEAWVQGGFGGDTEGFPAFSQSDSACPSQLGTPRRLLRVVAFWLSHGSSPLSFRDLQGSLATDL